MRRKKARVDTPIDELNKKDTIEHYNAILVEDIKATVQIVLEAVDSTRVSLEAKMEETKQELSQRLEAVEFAVVRHSKEIKVLNEKFDGLDKKVDCLDKKVDSVRTELKEDIARVEGNMVQMEKRLSDKIDNVVVTRIDDHENRITKLETTPLHPVT